jgi:crotonobetainyl-CoA:carnitine CoA-transferase CaiB-like acyl-CoA transferase
MCSISGFGQTGPYAAHAGHDLNYLAMAGYWSIPVQVEDKIARPKVRMSDYAASAYAALSLSVAIMSARQQGNHRFSCRLQVHVSTTGITYSGRSGRVVSAWPIANSPKESVVSM